MTDRYLNIKCGPADRDGKRVVIFTCGSDSHRERINTDDAFQRRHARERAIPRLGLDDTAHEEMEEQIIQAADSEDARAESAALFTPQITRLSTVTPRPIESLWHPFLYIGKVTLLCGNPGLGKSYVGVDLAARASSGDGWPDAPKEIHAERGVVILSAEDDVEDTIVPRLIAHNADLSRIVTLDGLKDSDDQSAALTAIDLTHHLDYVRAAVDQVEDCGLLVVDPISAFLGKTDSHKNAEVRCILAALSALAAEKRIAVLAITHLRKSGDGEAIHRAMGSLAFVAAARAAFVVCRDNDDRTGRRRLLLPLKNNLAADIQGLAYQLEPYGPDGAPVVAWDAEPVSMTADEALNSQGKKPGPKPERRQDAKQWLTEQLAAGPRHAGDLEAEAVSAGINVRTLRRAFDDINGVRDRDGFGGPVRWSLPIEDSEADAVQPVHLSGMHEWESNGHA
jgi:putative DNA primase/helicase